MIQENTKKCANASKKKQSIVAKECGFTGSLEGTLAEGREKQ